MAVVSTTLYIMLCISFLVLFKSLNEHKELNYANPFFYFFVFIIFYFGIPAVFVNDINFYYDWSLTESDMLFSNILVVILLAVTTFMFYVFRCINLNVDSKVEVSLFIKSIWLLILIYLILVLYLKLQNGDLMFSNSYTGTTDTYKLKNISYLLVTISVLYFSEKKSFFVFIPNILVAAFDLLEGSRTVALIAFIPIFVCYAIYNKKTYLSFIMIMFSILIAVGIFRNTLNSEQYDVPFYINAMGEFRETYILLPVMIFNDYFIGYGDLWNMLSSIFSPLLQPLRGELASTYISPGSHAAKLVGRGYGLGSNLLVESLYYGYLCIMLTIPLCLVYLYILRALIIKIDIVYAIIIISYSAIFIRLIVREGFLNNVMLTLFIVMFYCVPFLIFNKVFLKCSFKKR